LGLYLFLALAADRHGLSCWRLDRIERAMPCFDRHALWNARTRLAELDLIAFRPWHRDEPDGSYQVLSVGRGRESIRPQLQGMIAGLFRSADGAPARASSQP